MAKPKPSKAHGSPDYMNPATLEALFGQSAYGIIVIDLESTILWENQAFLRVMGAPAGLRESRLLGVKMKELPNVQGNPVGALILRLIHDLPERMTLEEPFESVYGKKMFVKVEVHRIDGGDGAPLGFIGSFEDVTIFQREEQKIRTIAEEFLDLDLSTIDKKDASTGHSSKQERMEVVEQLVERLRQREQDLSVLIHTISHHLRTPIISVSGLMGVVRQAAHEGRIDDMNQVLSEIESSMSRLSRTFRSVVEYNDFGAEVEETTRISTNNMIEAVLLSLSKLIAQHGATIIVDPNLPILTGHRKRVQRMFLEVIKNAVIYGSPDQSDHVIRVYPETGEGIQYIIVEDRGPGIPDSVAHHIFQPFARSHDDLKEDQTGVGLALAHRIAQAHGWGITVELSQGNCRIVFSISQPNKPKPTRDRPIQKLQPIGPP
jgi:PAS domain S-box-containing protein